MSGAGLGLIVGPASTDAVNRSIDASYGEVTGITQTVRNYASTLGIAVLGTVLTTVLTSRLTDSLTSFGVPAKLARSIAKGSAEAGSTGSSAGAPAQLREQVNAAVAHDFAVATQAVLYGMAVALAIAFVAARFHPGSAASSQSAANESASPR
jgi:hypothetical protein